MNPLITISIPIYNVEKYVERALISALNQTYDNIEILVIDDKGTDNSMEIVQRIISTHPRGNIVRIIDQGKNMGLGVTRNTSIDNAHGEFLFFMDSDDEITADCIEVLHSAMKETPVDFVVGSLCEVDVNDNILFNRIYIEALYINNNDILHSQYDQTWIKTGKSSCILSPLWNRLYNLTFLKRNKIRCIPGQRHEDMIFSFLLYLFADSCRILPQITYRYTIARPGSDMDENLKGFTLKLLAHQVGIIEFYSSFVNYIKENKPETSKHILAMIETRAAITKYRLIQSSQQKDVVKKLKQLTGDIRLSDLPVNAASWYFWLYLRAPKPLIPLLDLIYFKRRNIY